MAEDTPTEHDRDDQRRPSAAEAAAIAGGFDTTPDVRGGGSETAADGDSNPETPAAAERAWRRYVPFEQPYRQQIDAIDRAVEVFADGGYLAMEGACGTGKTLIALASAIHLIRDPETVATTVGDDPTNDEPTGDETTSDETDDNDEPAVERAVVATPVKQQLKQFVTELRAINRGLADPADELGRPTEDAAGGGGDDVVATDDTDSDDEADPEPIAGIVLRGKADMLPYAREGVGPFADEPVRVAAEDTREITVALIRRESTVTLDWPTHLVEHCSTDGCYEHVQGYATCPEHGSASDDDGPWYDPVRAQAVAERAAEIEGPRLETAGVETPYPAEVPHSTQVADDSEAVPTDAQGKFDPFLARSFANQRHPPFGFSAGPDGVLDGETLVREAAGAGVCPHESMATLLSEAEVAIGNYAHLFDPDTRKLTADKAGVLDDETLAIVDEAHMIEERVREMLSTTCSLHTLRIARNDVRYALQYLRGGRGDRGARHEAQEALRACEHVPEYDTFEEVVEFVEWLMDRLDEEVERDLSEAFGGWRAAAREIDQPEREIPLQDPDSDERDRLFETSREVFDPELWKQIAGVAAATEAIHDGVGESSRTTAIGAVAAFAVRWANESREGYFREITVEHSPKDHTDSTLPDWTGGFNASYYLFNCIPSERLAGVFDDLAGGIVMSATLEPFEVFTEAVGLQALAGDRERPGDAGDAVAVASKESGRRVETVRYGLSFPRENRASWVADAPAYTYRNRGPPTAERDRMTETRRTYADVLTDVATSEGNVLLCLPSYGEAEWARDVLDRAPGVNREVLLDRSTDSSATDAMLERFFAPDETRRVLVTSTRGTVTEGVDYAGERLHTCAVVGVPMVPPTPRTNAVVNAYDERFGDETSGFEMAVAVPAVRKARQAFGRVLRSPEEVGARVLVDGRYLQDDRRSVAEYLSVEERAEFARIPASGVGAALDLFWDDAARR